MALKQGTVDTCRKCGREIEWLEAPLELDENGVDKRPFWMRKSAWVDYEPPGEEVWNTYCDWEKQVGGHQPQNHCTWSLRDGGYCYAKVREPVDGLHFCGKHIKFAIKEEERKRAREEERQFDRWREETPDAILHYLRSHDIIAYPSGGTLPYWLRDAVVVDNERLCQAIESLELEILDLRRQLADASKG